MKKWKFNPVNCRDAVVTSASIIQLEGMIIKLWDDIHRAKDSEDPKKELESIISAMEEEYKHVLK